MRLSQAELNTITCGVLRIGSYNSNNVTIKSPILSPASWQTLSLISGYMISQTPGSTIQVDNLGVHSPGAVNFTENNAVGTLAGVVSSFTDVDNLTIGTVDGLTGIVADSCTMRTLAGNVSPNPSHDLEFGSVATSARAVRSLFGPRSDLRRG